MPDTQPVFRQGRGEEYAVYTGQVSASFAPGLAGITYPDPLYEIYRPRGDHYVFESQEGTFPDACIATNFSLNENGDIM